MASWTSLDLARYVVTTLVLAWAGFAIVRSQKPLLVAGRGWLWVTLTAAIALGHWPVNFWLDNPLICPIVVSLLYLVSLIGLAPDDTVLTASTSPVSHWFQRGLVAAMAGTIGGVMLWTFFL
ncbi:hypothetical protein MNR01_13300 [Lysobacter sp. S4-A87]|uniref:hypothetical protein n=1 Tax=Lysobacter sp. S4-A87 TaxID=2925843 RepID=UPI001F53C914|nr:hypothetical protein [Lysobacter sp. S4-A87]UNK48712.1 hypothetical protein MNR01_13300 [Lysobacter sp. S4-A87]